MGNLPKVIYERPKKGFVLPLGSWMKNELREYVEDIIVSFSILDKHVVSAYWDKYTRGKLHWSRIWSLVVLSKYLK